MMIGTPSEYIAIFLCCGLVVLFINFARKEAFEEEYYGVVDDVTACLDWGYSRSFHPFGMRVQMGRAQKSMVAATKLWEKGAWQDAYNKALDAQESMMRAQKIYCQSFIKRKSG